MSAIATIDLGKIRFKWRGAWGAGTAYTVDDVVSHANSSWVCITASTGNTPVAGSTYWELMALGGNPNDVMTTQGDLLVRGASALERLPKGVNDQYLVMQNGAPAWRNADVRVIQRYNFVGAAGQWESTTTWATVPDLSHTFTPKRSDSRIRYHWSWSQYWVGGAHSIEHTRFVRNGSVLRNWSTSAQYLEQLVNFHWDEASWGAGVAHNVQIQARDYNHNADASNFHGTQYWEGSGGNVFVPPVISIEEYLPAQ